MKLKTTYKGLIGSISVLGLVAFFQNCSQVSFDPAAQSLSSQGVGDGGPIIPSLKYKDMSQSVQVAENTAIDILFVIDNSGSMKAEQEGISNKISGFMEIIKNLDWQVALTTTDPGEVTKDIRRENRPWGDGQFRPFDSDSGSLFVLKKGNISLSDAQGLLAEAINVGIYGNGNERGIQVTGRSIERAMSSPAHQQFFRMNSKLVVVVISDEDECSNGSCLNYNAPSHPQYLVDLVKNKFGQQKVFKFNSIIKSPSDQSCTTAANTANVYDLMSSKTGGVVGSICDNDYTSILSQMGNTAVDLVKSANLACAPVDKDGDGKAEVVVTLEGGQIVTSGFQIQGETIVFDQSLPEGLHKIDYACLDI